MATEENFERFLGATWEFAFTARDADGVRIAPSAIDAVELRLSRRGRRVLTRSLANGGVAEDGESPPNFVITVTPANQSGLVAGVYGYLIWVTLSTGEESDQAFGAIHARE